MVARRAHNPKVVGSNPAPATNLTMITTRPASAGFFVSEIYRTEFHHASLSGSAPYKQQAKVVGSNPAPATNLTMVTTRPASAGFFVSEIPRHLSLA